MSNPSRRTLENCQAIRSMFQHDWGMLTYRLQHTPKHHKRIRSNIIAHRRRLVRAIIELNTEIAQIAYNSNPYAHD